MISSFRCWVGKKVFGNGVIFELVLRGVLVGILGELLDDVSIV